MAAFDYDGDAGLFTAKTQQSWLKPLRYRRFEHAAEAVRFAIEDLPAKALGACTLEVGEQVYTGSEIRWLYDSSEFPLERRIARRKRNRARRLPP